MISIVTVHFQYRLKKLYRFLERFETNGNTIGFCGGISKLLQNFVAVFRAVRDELESKKSGEVRILQISLCSSLCINGDPSAAL